MPQYSSNQTSFYYDPYRQGFDNNEWRILWGATPVLNNYRIELPNGGAIVSFSDILKGEVYFNVNFSVAPNSGDAVTTDFGLYSPLTGEFIGFYARQDGLFAKVSDGTNSTTSDELAWDSGWTNTNVPFKIVWEAGLVKFIGCSG